MKLKHIFFSIVFIMLLVGITCVSAENTDNIGDLSTNDADDIISVDDLEDNEDLSTNDVDNSLDDGSSLDEKDVLPSRGTTTVNSWSQLGSAVYNNNNYDTVYLGANITPGNQIVINHDVTIIGSADTYIGGSSSSNPVSYSNIPIYSNANGLSITLKDIRFQNCGGNILMKFSGNGNYVLDNCTFENVTATGSHQAVVHLNLGHCDIINCTFEKCRTSYGTVSNYNEYSVTNVNMVVRDTIFKNNYASVEPGAINNCGQLEVYDSTFEGNSAEWWAGAIHTHTNANTTIVRSSFKNNHAGWNGGALYTYSYLTIIDSNFTGNDAQTNTGGGAIGASSYGSIPIVRIENSKFEDNTAITGNGGAIVISSGTLTVSNSEFINNVAPKLNGGAISSSSCTATITNSIFKYNSAILGKGGAIYGAGAGSLTVDNCEFVNNTAKDSNSGHALAYSYTGNSNTAAYLTYINNRFYGPNNGTGSVYAANNKLNIIHYNNTVSDYSNYTEPEEENETNGTSGDIEIPEDIHRGNVNWTVNLGDALSGTPVIEGNYILIPAGHTLYCYYIDGTYVWNVTSDWGYFHELLVDNDVIYAPCSWDKLYILDLDTGVSLTNNNIYQGSSLYAPVMDAYGNIYIASEYGYGVNNNTWITVVTYENGDYVYSHSILEINNIPYGSPALLSQPIITDTGCFLVNTVEGLLIGDLSNGQLLLIPIVGAVGNFAIDYNNHYYYILMNTTESCGVLFTDDGINGPNGFYMDEIGELLIIDGYTYDYLYTVTEDGHIYFIDLDINHDDYGYPFYLYEDDGFQVNHVSSAMAAYDGMLYIGDDAGILWVVDTTCGESATINNYLSWAFNTNSSIVGGIAINNDFVYIGTENGMFYALTY
ncbi:PQQ-binding-like beta-propeller repeat protein [Methanobrevibacter thaueri]|uniref:Outer membrane protein assembly factor BamB n=1 Tax=Methanobrevibacter thaueri TaxID=190975 RepID=A0A315XMF1_9EURY|nr:PQQ-binding-like beta-propeller repeat protein [Methanobrevibacter thaueri]PWB87547.1 outer membrane protein assembly factor BamB [Methanobrevibacter thaueri]